MFPWATGDIVAPAGPPRSQAHRPSLLDAADGEPEELEVCAAKGHGLPGAAFLSRPQAMSAPAIGHTVHRLRADDWGGYPAGACRIHGPREGEYRARPAVGV